MGIRDLLRRLGEGEFDGGWSERSTNGTQTTLYIENGVPKRRYEGKSTRFFNGRENEWIQGKVEETEYRTPSQKKEFIKRYGFIGELFGFDEDAKKVSGEYYDGLEER